MSVLSQSQLPSAVASNGKRPRKSSVNVVLEGEQSARSLEQAFCQDFSCCGSKLKSLHDLLEHYESVHVHLEEVEEEVEDDDEEEESEIEEEETKRKANRLDSSDDDEEEEAANQSKKGRANKSSLVSSSASTSAKSLKSVKTLLAGRVFGGPKLPSPTERNLRQMSNAFKRSKLLHNHPFGSHQLQQQQQLFSSQDIYYYHYFTADSERDNDGAAAANVQASAPVQTHPSGWTINNRPSSMADSAFDDAVIRKKHNAAQHLVEIPSGFEPSNGDGFTTDEDSSATAVAGTALSQASVILPSHHAAAAAYHNMYHNDYTSTTVAPSMLSSSEDDDSAEPVHFDPDAIQTAAAKAIRLQKRYSSAQKAASPSPQQQPISNRNSTEFREDRRYKCLVPGCDKVYRNQNGLKYHIEHGHTKNERQYAEAVMRAIKEDPTEKPYACAIPACHKRYRNANGLKYHLIHHHNPNEVALYTNQ